MENSSYAVHLIECIPPKTAVLDYQLGGDLYEALTVLIYRLQGERESLQT
jgi:hypothetical protein